MRQTVERITVSLPRDLAKKARATAEKNFQPISKYIAELIWTDDAKQKESAKGAK